MPIRFRRTYKIFPGVKINVSKGGISTTVGPRGMHLTFNKQGVRQSVGLPGTGLSETSYLIKNEHDSERDRGSEAGAHARTQDDVHAGGDVGCFPWGCLAFIVIVLVVGYFGANAMGWLPPNYLSHLLQQAGL